MSEPKLDWSTAEVKDRQLTVRLDGEPPRGWRQSFEAVARLLGSGDWSEIELKKHKLHVTGVQPGSEEKLAHHLEAVVQQANADTASSDEPPAGSPSGSENPTSEGKDGADAQMAERFRSYASEPEA